MPATFQLTHPFVPRPVTPLPLRTYAGWRLKTYAIHSPAEALDEPVYAAALPHAFAALPTPAVTAARPGVGFLICHQGRGWHYLVLGWWDNENELPLRVFVRPRDTAADWRPAAATESVCVWDLEVLWHERQAYIATILTHGPRAIDDYLANQLHTTP